jgi:hypothetical protein
VLLKVVPHVKYWWETFCEKKETEEPSLFIVVVTWESFRDAIKEQYYPVRSYDNLYTKWTTLWKERDQASARVHKYLPYLAHQVGYQIF